METKVRVGFSTSPKLVSRFIRWITKSKVSHTWLLLYDPTFGVEMVMQATMGGFHLESYDTFKKHSDVIAVFDLEYPIDKGLKQAALWLGYRYDYLGLFGVGFVIIGGWFKRKWNNPWDSSKAMFCSEAVVRVLVASSYPDSGSLGNPGNVNPQQFMNFLEPKAVKVDLKTVGVDG